MRLAAVLVGVLALAGCAGSKMDYTPPMPREVATERILEMPFEKAWDAYVAELSKTFFVINNISKESRIINVSFSSDKPSDFVDCGYTVRTSTHPATGQETFSYYTADSSTYNAGQPGTNILWHMRRTTSLSGRANIYMAPRDKSSTLLRVNAKYVLTIEIRGESNVGGMYFDDMSVTFTSTQPGTDQSGEMRCVSKGVLEEKLLHLL